MGKLNGFLFNVALSGGLYHREILNKIESVTEHVLKNFAAK